ncbi:Por secretion system C-terminal sorting domain-containing protein [Saccharicrinis carchari]|uniref:Por secretion system C-terminal sorting domain-containing protein n=1 Tax=Saccharicrinis carchari TaxID=1168039 RepID=A0A521AFU8_SACCC|nr:M4 family metallopeptidase [Saccharicrinis carchari]SMO33685.1 Por secretion system C-terminal sorting domain-containing protein [Saccharicrinis carchari]
MRGLITILTLALSVTGINAQLFTGRQSNDIVDGTQKVRVNKNTGLVEYFELSPSSLKTTDAMDGGVLKQKIGLPNAYHLKIEKKQIDSRGNKHEKFQLYFNNIPVEGMGYSVHFKNGKVVSASGKAIKTTVAVSVPSISKVQAIKKAISLFKAREFIWDSTPALYPQAQLLYVPGDSLLTLCYKIDVYALQPMQREYVYINALSGEVVKRVSRIHHADYTGTALTQYSGTVEITTSLHQQGYVLNEHSRGQGIFTYSLNHNQYYTDASEIVDNDNYWDNPTDQVAYDAHYGAQKTYDYFFYKFGRNSIDDNGFALKSYVHYGNNYGNAFWDGDRMTYGDGDGIIMGAFTSLDIVGHEITHGLISHTADLEYLNEPGALNESFADIFGLAIDFYANPGTANYLVGEQIYLDGTSYMRSMADPKSKFQPDTYQGDYWVVGMSDHGGVHSNSMVQNYWFYLLCEGGHGVNDKGNSYMVEAIGIEAAEAIAYRNLTVYLSRYSNFEDARFYAIQSAIDLYGACSNEVIQVTNAWYAVGVGAPFENAVTAAFTAEQTNFCGVPSTIALQSISTHAQSYTWYLNGVEFSTEPNPVLNIAFPGEYDVKLEVTGTSACNTGDVIEVENYISVSQQSVPVPAVHIPASLKNSSGGIYSISINQIDHRSQGANEGYADFTCGNQTELTEGIKYKLAIRTGTEFKEAVGVWLDINNDGLFAGPNENIFTSTATTYHNAEIKIPAGKVFDVPLRLRVGSDRFDYATTLDAQNSSHYGQYEDYTVILRRNTNAPVANFTMSDTLVFVNGSVSFEDVSDNISTNRSWYFEGGQPEYTSEPNPTVTYLADGVYNVELTVANEFGSTTKSQKIRVATNFKLGIHTQSTFPSGYIYDSGGANGNYLHNAQDKFLIEPSCAKEVLLTIEAFETEGCCDGLKIYDGKDETAPLLASIKGVADVPMLIKATSGSMFLVFSSDATVSAKGFKARWSTVGFDSGTQVKADFYVEDENLPVNFDLHFVDNSKPKASVWEWDFGNGDTSNEPNPVYKYTHSGSYEVQLAVDNCVSKDTLKKQLSISAPPQLLVGNDTVRINILSGQKVDSFIRVDNINHGLLAYTGELKAIYQKGKPQSPIRYYDATGAYNGLSVGLARNVFYYIDLKNNLTTQGALCKHITKANLSESLNSLDVLIVDDSADFLVSGKNELREWICKGGFLIIQGDGIIAQYNDVLQGTGISYEAQAAKGGEANLLAHQITESLNGYLIGNYAECTLKVSAPAVRLINDGVGNCYSALTELDNGKILAMSDESFQYFNAAGHQQLMYNALMHCIAELGTSVCDVERGYSFMTGIQTDSLSFKINARRLIQGEYVADILINNNDIASGPVVVPVLLKVTGIENIVTDADQLNYVDVPIHTEQTLTLNIKNSGTRNLSLTEISSTSDAFNAVFTPMVLVPGQVYSVDVNFAPTLNQNYLANLKVHSSDPDSPITTIVLQGSTVDVSTDVEKAMANNALQVYPNPVQSVLHIQTNKRIDTLQLIGTDGRVVIVPYDLNFDKARIHMSVLPHGVYLVKIRTADKEWISRVIKR